MHLIMHCLAGHASLPVHSLAYHNVTFDSSKRQVSTACQGFDVVLKLQQQLTCLVFTITAFPMKGFSHKFCNLPEVLRALRQAWSKSRPASA